MTTASTRAAAEVATMYPKPSAGPVERALYHLGHAVSHLGLAAGRMSDFARAVERADEDAVANGADTCAWNLESAEWHLSQIPVAYRSTSSEQEA